MEQFNLPKTEVVLQLLPCIQNNQSERYIILKDNAIGEVNESSASADVSNLTSWSGFDYVKSSPGSVFYIQQVGTKYNLIASGVGHHIHESRWLRNPMYLDQVVETWYRGNNGQPMKKLHNFSSWIAASLWNRYLVDGRQEWITQMLPDLCDELFAS